MNYKKVIENNLDKIHTTYLSEKRIINNLDWSCLYYSPLSTIIWMINYLKYYINKKGKNYYLTFIDKEFGTIVITINSSTFTIITAHER